MLDDNASPGDPATPRSGDGGTPSHPSDGDARLWLGSGDGYGDGVGDGGSYGGSYGDGATPRRDDELERSNLQELAGMLPDLARLLPALLTDERVPLRTKVVAGAAAAYIALPVDPLPEVLPGTGIGIDDLAALAFAVRHLVAGAGYEVVRERWTGTDAGFAFLLLFTGVEA